jgi:acetyltransferase
MPAASSRATTPKSDTKPVPAEKVELGAGSRVLIRAIRPDDLDAMQRAFKRLTPGQVRSRFFHTLTELPAAVAAAMCDIDPESTVSLVATDLDAAEIRGEARVHIDTVTESAEFALAIDPAFTGKGLGRALLSRLIAECRTRQLEEIWGETQADNAGMLALARGLGFDLQRESGDAGLVRMNLSLQTGQVSRQLPNAA